MEPVSLFGFLGQIIEAILSFVPRLVVIRATHRGVKWKRGKYPVAVGPGLAIYWPLVSELEQIPVARQTLNLPTQHLVTSDDVPVALGGFVVYTIEDIVLAIGEKNFDVDDTVSDLAQAALVEEVIGLSYSELLDGLSGGRESEVYEAMTQNLHEQLEEFGVAVERAGLTDFAKCRVFRILQD